MQNARQEHSRCAEIHFPRTSFNPGVVDGLVVGCLITYGELGRRLGDGAGVIDSTGAAIGANCKPARVDCMRLHPYSVWSCRVGSVMPTIDVATELFVEALEFGIY